MNRSDVDEQSAHKFTRGEPVRGQGRESTKIGTAAKAFRAVTAVVVFGIPLIAGVAALVSYGAHRAYRRITGNP